MSRFVYETTITGYTTSYVTAWHYCILKSDRFKYYGNTVTHEGTGGRSYL